MWVEGFEKMSNSEKEEMKRLLNVLLSKTYIVRDVYDTKEMMMKINPDYRFLERHFEIVSDYLSYSGWDVSKDNQYGVISIDNIYEYNKVKLDRFTTMTLYTIRLIYEEERERVTLRNEIMTTTGQIFHKMITLNVLKRKPADREMTESLRILAEHNVIQKISGNWADADARILILPSILFIVTNEKISRLHELLAEDPQQPETEAGTGDTDEPDIIRGEAEAG